MNGKINWLLVLVPITLVVRYTVPNRGVLIFVLAALSMIPLAKLLSDATEHLAARTGSTLGALLNVTFGNAGELVIGFFALRAGLQTLVKASITGSILVNLLLTLGLSMLAGGLRTKTLKFNPLAARTRATMLLLAAISLILPAGYSHFARNRSPGLSGLSLKFSVVLLLMYGLGLFFSLHTHEDLLNPGRVDEAAGSEIRWSVTRGMVILTVGSLLVGWIGEVLVGSIDHAATSLGMTELFVGLVIVAAAGNATESTAAIRAAMKNRMDLSVGIAVGSSIQIALFVAPVLVVLSRFVGPRPMDLVFTPVEIVALVLTVVIVGQIASDGDSNWLEGAQLVAVYIMLAVLFFYLPAPAAPGAAH